MTSRNILFNSSKSFDLFEITRYYSTKALTGSQVRADLKLSNLFLRIDTPHGLACFTITIALYFLVKDFEMNILKIYHCSYYSLIVYHVFFLI